jgi:hypothetical protein
MSFSAFLSGVKRRASYRTPKLDTVLSVLEHAAADLKADMAGLPSAMYADYQTRAEEMLCRLIAVTEKVLGSMGPARGDGKLGVEAEIFVGRVALFLAKSSDFLQDVAGEAGVETSESVATAKGSFADSLVQLRLWRIYCEFMLLQQSDGGRPRLKKQSQSWRRSLTHFVGTGKSRHHGRVS